MRPRPQAQLDAVARLVASHPRGVGIADLAAEIPSIPRRTLQRHLAALVAQGRLRASGRSTARRYFAAAPSVAPSRPTPAGEWRSHEGAEVQALVRRPLSSRQPVGYQRALLDDYRPNTDAYLDEPLRERLHTLGRSPGGSRPAGTYARQVLDRLLIDLSWASSQLEGNTYSRLDTHNLIEFGRLADGKDQREAQMILNHKAAIEMLVEDANAIGFNRYTLLNLHALLAENLLANPSAAGRVRRIPVRISGMTYQPTAIPAVLDECFDELLVKAEAIDDPFEQAFFVMVHVPYLQPFEDVNKPVSRLAANIGFIQHNLAPLSFVDIPTQDYTDAILGVYELARVELLRDLFAWAYDRSCQRYTVLRDALPAPDPVRLRNRVLLAELVRDTVRERERIEPAALRARAAPLAAPDDLDPVVAMAVNELHLLHEGNLARFRLRLAELRAWIPIRDAADADAR